MFGSFVVALAASFGGLLGLIAGSFMNVVAYRVPLGRSVVRPRSACTSCDTEITPRDNIPVVSWLLLRGRCRQCGARFSVRYPLVEAATAGLFVAVPFVIGASWTIPAYWWFVGVSVVLVVTDFDHKRIPNRILFPGIVVGTVLLGVGSAVDGDLWSMGRALGGGAAYFGGLLLIALVARGGFGYGDVKLGFLLGEFLAYQSWGILAAGSMLAILIGGAVAVVLMIARRVSRKDAIPFGPSMVAGAFTALVVGQRIVDWYVGA
ncbi:MAG: prepilin peptidase [Acidimicrobiia bacterium]|nr:prepilin peptidase [Acidimicrobiia bacterium]